MHADGGSLHLVECTAVHVLHVHRRRHYVGSRGGVRSVRRADGKLPSVSRCQRQRGISAGFVDQSRGIPQMRNAVERPVMETYRGFTMRSYMADDQSIQRRPGFVLPAVVFGLVVMSIMAVAALRTSSDT